MANIVNEIIERARKLNKNIVLCEGEDSRVVKAAAEVAKDGFARVTLLGDEAEIRKANPETDLSGVEIVNPKTDERHAKYANLLYELRKAKGMTEEEADKLAYDNTYFGMLLLKDGACDGLVSGACHSTANTLRPGLQIIKTAPGVPLVSSCSLMIAPNGKHEFCEDGALIFADTGLEQNPTSEKLAYIALGAAKHCEALMGVKPRVAFLSHSTKGSAKHADVDKVVLAFEKFKEIAPDYAAEGELQLDAALVPSVASMKAPGSAVAGHANVLVFPDLDCGNIGYKLVERLGGFMAVGPLCQGFAKPINDLSRGCKWEDIYVSCAVTALQSDIKW
ncbi:MAG: phosphate acetyltransferase [Christensenellaceae bacterium]